MGEGLHEEGPGELGQVSWAGQRRVGEKPHISSRRNLVSRPVFLFLFLKDLGSPTKD